MLPKLFIARQTRPNYWAVIQCLQPDFEIPHLSRQVAGSSVPKTFVCKAGEVAGWQLSRRNMIWIETKGEAYYRALREFDAETFVFEPRPAAPGRRGPQENVDAWRAAYVEEGGVELVDSSFVDVDEFINAHNGLVETSRIDTVKRAFKEQYGAGWVLRFVRHVS